MTFGEILKSLREDKDLKQEDIAKLMNVDRSTVGKWESSPSKPDYEKLIKLADYFNVSLDYLLGRTNIKEKSDQITNVLKNDKKEIPAQFTTPEEAMKFILEQNVIMGFGGFDINMLSDEEKIEFANELLNQLKLLSYKYKK